ncbi:uncharacterized protein H6S33_000708 [Morchella sextelata]|uniref:uncharacterized protein n=1 Tax=Morchella sextelata TaxID=1174677 RepID=UPI001D057CE9|nr:uncharacterized protein H6S33_000708 [Morchella sextelata]KAH0615072.1 hypothetical protein H6S33_000708 [Morchella sextelata]
MPTSTNSATPSGGVEAEKARTYVKPKPSTKASYGGPKNGHGCSEDTTTTTLFRFTSTYSVVATADQVVNATDMPAMGEKNATGYFNYGINSHEDVICYNITLLGVTGDYQSPAFTATHIHQAMSGKAGPPRIAFPNPIGNDTRRNSVGCLKGPFRTGIIANGFDTGEGFFVRQIEANPMGFFTDVHTRNFPAGALRAQLERNLDGSKYSW